MKSVLEELNRLLESEKSSRQKLSPSGKPYSDSLERELKILFAEKSILKAYSGFTES